MQYIRYLNQDLVKQTRSGDVHQLYYPAAKVNFNDIDWTNRITFYKNKKLGKVTFASPVPPSDEIFISFPLVIDSHYSGIVPIVDEINIFANKYNLSQNLNLRYFPHISCKILESFDVPLTKISKRITELFGTHENSIWERSFLKDREYKNTHYKQVIAKGISIGSEYTVGETLPFKTLTAIDLYTDKENGMLKKINIKGEKEEKQIEELNSKKNELIDKIDMLEKRIFKNKEEYKTIENRIIQLNEDVNDKSSDIIKQPKVIITNDELIDSMLDEENGIKFVENIEKMVIHVDISRIVRCLKTCLMISKSSKLNEVVNDKLMKINKYYISTSKILRNPEYEDLKTINDINIYRNITSLQTSILDIFLDIENDENEIKNHNNELNSINSQIIDLKLKLENIIESNEKRKLYQLSYDDKKQDVK